MDFLFEPLNLVIFFPLLGVFVLLFLKERDDLARWVSLVTALITSPSKTALPVKTTCKCLAGADASC